VASSPALSSRLIKTVSNIAYPGTMSLFRAISSEGNQLDGRRSTAHRPEGPTPHDRDDHHQRDEWNLANEPSLADFQNALQIAQETQGPRDRPLARQVLGEMNNRKAVTCCAACRMAFP
jgi:hypothetical protein